MLEFLPKTQLQPFLREVFPGKTSPLKKLTGGLLNQNYTFTSEGERYVLKVFRPEVAREKFEEVRRVMEFASQKGVPISPFLASCVIDDHIVVLDRFVTGEHPSHFKKTPAVIRSMGATLGKIHLALDQFKTNYPKKSSNDLISWNKEAFLKEIQDVRRAARRSKIVSSKDLEASLDVYQTIIEGSEDWDREPFEKLPIKLCQGDYHTQNILVHDDKVAVVLDWEKFGWQWRSFEVMRSIIFNCRKNWKELDWESIATYLKAYKRHVSLTEREKELCFEVGFRKTLFSLWIENQYLKTGDADLLDGMKRRVAILPWLAKHREETAERIAKLL